jgi:hypothetical protein
MKRLNRISRGSAWLASAFLLCGIARAQTQQKMQISSPSNRGYDASRETAVEGKVVQYTPASTVPPLGAHVTVQTGSGTIDVHLGNAQLLAANHLTLSSGDTVRIVGENVAYGNSTQFLARLVQKGNQVLAVRSTRGFPLSPSGKFGPRTEGGAL